MNFYNNKIHISLKTLIKMKSTRDGVDFTLYQLAKALNISHSVLLRLIHHLPTKRVNNPRVDTLFKIVEFFKSDGFNITVNDLLIGFTDESEVNILEQEISPFFTDAQLPLYSFNSIQHHKIGNIKIKLATNSINVIALLSEEEIKPLFKKGSIFIIDTKADIENDTLVAVKVENNHQIMIKKFHIEKSKKILKSYDNSVTPLILNPKLHSIIGVVIQVNAKT